MTEGCAQSEDYVPPEEIRYVVLSHHDKRPDRMSTSHGVRDLATALLSATAALENGATEIVIRSVR